MKTAKTTKDCPRCCSINPAKKGGNERYFGSVVRFGQFKRKGSRTPIQRYLCRSCEMTFSDATTQFEFRQKKRKINLPLFELMVSNVSMRRAAQLIHIDQKTVARRFNYFAAVAELHHKEFLKNRPSSTAVQFDDMETSEHSKLKPLSIPLMVDEKEREILSYAVAQMPAKGKLASISRKKYGYRKDLRRKDGKLFLLTQDKLLPSVALSRAIVTRCIRSGLNAIFLMT